MAQRESLDAILTNVFPKFGLELRNARVRVDDSVSMQTSALDYTIKPDLFDAGERDFLDGITFKIPSQLAEDSDLATAYFAHECSHLELLKKPYHIGHFIALTAAVHLTRPLQEIAEGTREPPHGKGCALEILGLVSRLVAYVPFALYGNTIERVVDRNAAKRGYAREIGKLREAYPLKIFR